MANPVSPKDVKAAKYIVEIERSLRKSKVYLSKLKRAKKEILKSSIYSHYAHDLDKVISIKKSLRKNTYFSCNQNIQFKYKNNVHKRFLKHLSNYCLTAYSYLINDDFNLKNKSMLVDLNSAILHYLKRSPSLFVRKIEKLDKEKNAYKYIKSQIIFLVLEHGLTPNKKLFAHIDFNNGLTHFMQTGLHNIKRNKLVFTQEFVKLYRQFKRSIRKNKIKEAIQLSEQLLSFQNENTKYIYGKTAWKSLVVTGKKLLRKNYNERARKIFSHTISLSYNFETYNESLFQLLWSSIHKKDYKTALKDIEKRKLIDSFPKLSSKVKFWIAYSLHTEGDRSIAKHLFKLIINNNPLSYYSIISQKYLPSYGAEKSKDIYLKNREIASDSLTLNDFNKPFKSSIYEMFVWKKLNYISKVDLLLKDFIKAQPSKVVQTKELLSDYDDEELKTLKFNFFMKLFKSNSDFLSSFKFISKAIDMNMVSSSLINIRNLFPTLYEKEIRASKTGLDHNLVLSLIRQESAFNHEAKSRVGARGLMQLMPNTAKRFVRVKKLNDLYEPMKNVRAGSLYLKKLLKRFDGNLVLALGSYNAGPTKVKRWMKNIFSTDDPIFMVEEIPYRETRLYVKLIYRNLFFYSLQKNEYLLDDKLKDTFTITFNQSDRNMKKIIR